MDHVVPRTKHGRRTKNEGIHAHRESLAEGGTLKRNPHERTDNEQTQSPHAWGHGKVSTLCSQATGTRPAVRASSAGGRGVSVSEWDPKGGSAGPQAVSSQTHRLWNLEQRLRSLDRSGRPQGSWFTMVSGTSE